MQKVNERIQVEAFILSEKAGHPAGRAEEFWAAAERKVLEIPMGTSAKSASKAVQKKTPAKSAKPAPKAPAKPTAKTFAKPTAKTSTKKAPAAKGSKKAVSKAKA